jgi:hypothetical protein
MSGAVPNTPELPASVVMDPMVGYPPGPGWIKYQTRRLTVVVDRSTGAQLTRVVNLHFEYNAQTGGQYTVPHFVNTQEQGCKNPGSV